MSRSHFTFTFRLSPWDYCLHLHFQDKMLAEGFKAVCVRDYMGVFWVGEPDKNEAARGFAHVLARTLVQAHAYYSFPNGPLLDVEPVTWLEIRDCEAKYTVYGYMHPSLVTIPLQEGHPDNISLLRAIDLVLALNKYDSLRFALADFHVARRELGPYSAFYAYRVLEDVGFSFGATKEDKPDWDSMNENLKTCKEKWKPLIDAGTWARHLSGQSLRKLTGVNPGELLALSREALTLALEHFGVVSTR